MINQQLQQARLALNLTQKDVCDELKWKRIATLSEFENGHRGLSSHRVNQLMDLYGLTTTDIQTLETFDKIVTLIKDRRP